MRGYRRGIGEIVGAFIIITIITSSSIILAYTITHAGKKSANLIESKIRKFEEQSQELVILPYVQGSSLRLFVSPLAKGEKIKIYLVNGSKIYFLEKTVNNTYFNGTIMEDYNCGNIEIAVERETGALFVYNALRDPRANLSAIVHNGDPRIFNCKLLKNHNMNIVDPLSKEELAPLSIPRITYNASHLVGLSITATLKGNIAYPYDGNRICNVRLSAGNQSIQVKGRCEARIRAYTSKNYNISIVLNETRDKAFIYAVIMGKKPGTVYSGTARASVQLGYLAGGGVDPGMKTSGTINNSVIPLVLSQYSISNTRLTTTIIYSSNTYLKEFGIAKGTFYTNGPILLSIITNKINEANIYIKIILNITYETEFYGSARTFYEVKGSTLEIEGRSYWNITSNDILAGILNKIPPKDWGTNTPQIALRMGRIVKTYNIYYNSHYIFYNDKEFEASLIWDAGFNLPWLTGLTVTTINRTEGTKVIREINGNSTITAIPIKQFMPIIIKINNKKYLADMDYPGPLNLENIGIRSSLSPYVIYALDGYRVTASQTGARLLCYTSVTGMNPLPSRLINQTAECSRIITLKSQKIGLLILIKYNSSPHASFPFTGVAYRITWTS